MRFKRILGGEASEELAAPRVDEESDHGDRDEGARAHRPSDGGHRHLPRQRRERVQAQEEEDEGEGGSGERRA